MKVHQRAAMHVLAVRLQLFLGQRCFRAMPEHQPANTKRKKKWWEGNR
jgi:hypothetical protein